MAAKSKQAPGPPRRMPAKRWKAVFLADFAVYGNVSQAARVAKVTRQTVYAHREADPEFLAAMDDAQEQASDVLELEARRRAVEGVQKPVFQRGELVGTIREYSDTLLVVLLKANRPDKFKERGTMEHSGAVGMLPLTEVVVERPAAPGPDEGPPTLRIDADTLEMP